MAQMTAVHISRPGAPFEVVAREIPEPWAEHGTYQSAGLRRLS
jgi:hypothetical protein